MKIQSKFHKKSNEVSFWFLCYLYMYYRSNKLAKYKMNGNKKVNSVNLTFWCNFVYGTNRTTLDGPTKSDVSRGGVFVRTTMSAASFFSLENFLKFCLNNNFPAKCFGPWGYLLPFCLFIYNSLLDRTPLSTTENDLCLYNSDFRIL